MNPLKIYLYNEGFIRLATVKYTNPTSINKESTFMHLTNYSLNKYNEASTFTEESTGLAPELNKNSLLRSVEHFKWWLDTEYAPKTSQRVWNEIGDVCTKTILASRDRLDADWRAAGQPDCFHILGFDVMLDADLKPWFIEINHNPDLLDETNLCRIINTSLIHEFLEMHADQQLRGIENVGDVGGWEMIYSDLDKRSQRRFKHLQE